MACCVNSSFPDETERHLHAPGSETSSEQNEVQHESGVTSELQTVVVSSADTMISTRHICIHLHCQIALDAITPVESLANRQWYLHRSEA